MSDGYAARLMNLFQGFELAHGRYDATVKNQSSGKFTGEAVTYKRPVTLEAWQEHIDGIGPNVGIIPLMTNNCVMWGAIDIDDYKTDHDVLARKINELGLPLVHVRSKSGGAHLYVLFKEPFPAHVVQKKLNEWASFLGYGGCEVNPKQTTRIDLTTDVGNWLNMPYYDGLKHTLRYALKDGKALTLGEFLDYAEGMKISDFDNIDIKEPVLSPEDEGLFEGGPPCLKTLMGLGGFPEGTRNDGLYAVGVYLRKRFPNDWENRIVEYNSKLCSPPLALSEINSLIKSLKKKEYDYKCKNAPIAQHCNRKVCLTCPFGVGETENFGRRVEITNITKFAGDPVLWAVEVNEVRMFMTTEDLYSQARFNQMCMDNLSRLPGTLPKPRWERYIDEHIGKADIIYSPKEVSPQGVFEDLLNQFMSGQAQAKSKEELRRNIPWNGGDGYCYFHANALYKYLDTQNFKQKEASRHQIWQWLRDIGAEASQVRLDDNTTLRVWRVPFKMERVVKQQVPDFGGEEF